MMTTMTMVMFIAMTILNMVMKLVKMLTIANLPNVAVALTDSAVSLLDIQLVVEEIIAIVIILLVDMIFITILMILVIMIKTLMMMMILILIKILMVMVTLQSHSSTSSHCRAPPR